MNELIKVDNGVALLDEETAVKIAEMERVIKDLKQIEDDLRQRLLTEMQEKNVRKLETNEIVLTLVDATDKETFDSKQFRAEHADIYDQYVRISPVKANVRVKLK